MKKNKRYTSSDMFPMIDLYKESDLGRSAFCKEMGIKLHTFNYWLDRYKKSSQEESGFVPIKVVGTEDRETSSVAPTAVDRIIRIETSNGLLIEIPV